MLAIENSERTVRDSCVRTAVTDATGKPRTLMEVASRTAIMEHSRQADKQVTRQIPTNS